MQTFLRCAGIEAEALGAAPIVARVYRDYRPNAATLRTQRYYEYRYRRCCAFFMIAIAQILYGYVTINNIIGAAVGAIGVIIVRGFSDATNAARIVSTAASANSIVTRLTVGVAPCSFEGCSSLHNAG